MDFGNMYEFKMTVRSGYSTSEVRQSKKHPIPNPLRMVSCKLTEMNDLSLSSFAAAASTRTGEVAIDAQSWLEASMNFFFLHKEMAGVRWDAATGTLYAEWVLGEPLPPCLAKNDRSLGYMHPPAFALSCKDLALIELIGPDVEEFDPVGVTVGGDKNWRPH